jgi:hypothetical protein
MLSGPVLVRTVTSGLAPRAARQEREQAHVLIALQAEAM